MTLPRKLLRLRRVYFIAAGLILGALVVSLVVEANTYYVRDMLAEEFWGSKPHRVLCDKWPTPDEVQRIIDQNSEVVNQIESVNPGFVTVNINTLSCPGRADIRILYASYSDRDAIRPIIGDSKYFFGVPYQLRNT